MTFQYGDAPNMLSARLQAYGISSPWHLVKYGIKKGWITRPDTKEILKAALFFDVEIYRMVQNPDDFTGCYRR